MLTAVYIPPDANAIVALGHLYDTISSQQSSFPEAIHIIAGDFNHVDLKTALPKLHQHVKCATRGDHMALHLIPAYTPRRKSASTTTRTVKTWPEGASEQLQDCFESTDWDIFKHQDLGQYTTSVLDYIKYCIDNVTVEKRIWVYPNRKPWMTEEVQCLLRERNIAFRAGDAALNSTARSNPKRGIREAKADYKRKIEYCFKSNNSRQVWQGVQHITNY